MRVSFNLIVVFFLIVINACYSKSDVEAEILKGRSLQETIIHFVNLKAKNWLNDTISIYIESENQRAPEIRKELIEQLNSNNIVWKEVYKLELKPDFFILEISDMKDMFPESDSGKILQIDKYLCPILNDEKFIISVVCSVY
jgi:hypothetical protein